jgi:hypothetical protein
MFNDEDRLMVDMMDAPPERLYRPDVAITEWRKLVENTARGPAQGLTPRFAKWEWDETQAEHPGLPMTHRFRTDSR